MKNKEHSFKRLDLSGVIPGSILQSLVLNAAIPYMLYQVLTPRLSNLPALLIITLLPLAGITLSLYQKQALNLVSVGALLAIAFTFASLLLHGDIKTLLLQLSLPTAMVGGALLLSQFSRRPLFFYLDRYIHTSHDPSSRMLYHDRWQNEMIYRFTIFRINLVWGIILFATALILLTLYLTLTPQQFLPLYPYIPYALYALLIALMVWTVQYKNPSPQDEDVAEHESHKN